MFSNPQKNLDVLGVTSGMKIADFGIGGGFYSLPAARMVGSEGKVYAIDLQEGLLQKLKVEATRLGFANIELISADLEILNSTPIRDNYLDASIIANILFQLDTKENIALEAFRVLRLGGKLLVVDWVDSFGGLGPQQKFICTENDAKDIFSKAGFKVVNTFNAGDHHYGIIFKK